MRINDLSYFKILRSAVKIRSAPQVYERLRGNVWTNKQSGATKTARTRRLKWNAKGHQKTQNEA